MVTSLVLAAGFSTSIFASFKPPIFFGGLSVVTILVALAADLTLLPVLLVKLRIAGSEANRPSRDGGAA